MFSRLNLGFRKVSLQSFQGLATTAKSTSKTAKVASKSPSVPKVPAADKKVFGRRDLTEAIKEDTSIELSKSKVDELLLATFSLIKRLVMEENKQIRFTGLGTFYKRTTAARSRRNPSTGANFESPASEKLGFRASSLTRSQIKK